LPSENGKPYSYTEAGVDIDAGEALVERIKPLAAATARPGVAPALGGFGGLFDLKAAGYEDPILVAATDGVGTKVKLALDLGRFDTIGIDLVAMCVNDLVVQGAEPLFFLDYMAAGQLDVDRSTELVKGIAEGCHQANAALIGGETAEMPGLYADQDFDLAGFAVGAVERGRQLTGSEISGGDKIIGLKSSGVHSNGFSLVRKLLEDKFITLSDKSTFDETKTFGESFLIPTRIYVENLLPLLKDGLITGLAHITGGGLVENIPRVLPAGLRAEIHANSWSLPGIFEWLRTAGNLSPRELIRTFNCGVGMVVIATQENAGRVTATLSTAGEDPMIIGQVIEGAGNSLAAVTGEAGDWGFAEPWQVTGGLD
jgi:phosphoribosylformylglycinamidine cyclo-ligase